MNTWKRSAVFLGAVSLALMAAINPAARAVEVSIVGGFELLESKTLSEGWGTLRLWRNIDNGCLHADIVNAPKGVVATERDDGQVITYARNHTDGGSASTAETHTRNGDIRGVMRSDSGRSTFTKFYYAVSVC